MGPDELEDTGRTEGPPPPDAPRPAATFLTVLFTVAMFVNMWWDSQSTDYNGVQNSLILAAMATSPPGIRIGRNLLTKLFERYLNNNGDRR